MDGGLGLLTAFAQWGAAGIVMGLIALGWLIPKNRHDKEISLIEKSKDEALAREAHYRDTVDKQNEVIRMQAAQMKDLMEHAETTVALLEALEARARGDFGGPPTGRKPHTPTSRSR